MTKNGFDASKLVYVENGPYELRETRIKENKFCNIISVPTVTVEDAFASCFAVVKNTDTKYVDRAMQMIYAINNDDTLHNYLQYGIAETNYDVIDKDDRLIKLSTEETGKYYMNPRYTGDIFGLLYCEELGWTEDKVAPSKMQNDASVFRP